MIKVTDLTKQYGKKLVLDGINIQVNRGEVVGVIGPPGAGKTVLLGCLSGRVKPSHGQVTHAKGTRPGLVLGSTDLIKDKTGEDHIAYLAKIHGVPKDHVDDLRRSLSSSVLMNPPSEYSSQDKVSLLLALARLTKPDYILFDVDFGQSLDEKETLLVSEMRRLQEVGVTMVIAGRETASIPLECSQLLFLHKGRPFEFSDEWLDFDRCLLTTESIEGLAKYLDHQYGDLAWTLKEANQIEFLVARENIAPLLADIQSLGYPVLQFEQRPVTQEVLFNYFSKGADHE